MGLTDDMPIFFCSCSSRKGRLTLPYPNVGRRNLITYLASNSSIFSEVYLSPYLNSTRIVIFCRKTLAGPLHGAQFFLPYDIARLFVQSPPSIIQNSTFRLSVHFNMKPAPFSFFSLCRSSIPTPQSLVSPLNTRAASQSSDDSGRIASEAPKNRMSP